MTDDINKLLEERGHVTKVFSVENGFKKDYGIGKISDSFLEKSMVGGFFRKYIGFNPNIEDISFVLTIQNKLDTLTKHFDMLWSNGEFWCANLIKKLSVKHNQPCLIFFGGGMSRMMEIEAKMLPDIFVVLSPVFKEWLDKKVPDCNVKCIPSGVDIDLFQKTESLYDPALYEHPIVCSTSALIKDKRIDLIIDALHKLGKGTLFVTSDGPMREQIVEKGKRLLGKRFHYLGVIPFNDLPKLYSMSDVFVLASDNEPWGAVLFEAMACGCNVVTQRDRTREYMLEKEGIMIGDCSDMEMLTDGINLAVDCRNPKALRKQAEKFSWQKTVDGYEAAINEVMKSA
jgi:glycosyltransferase involved in cell wall biosynthesis